MSAQGAALANGLGILLAAPCLFARLCLTKPHLARCLAPTRSEP